MAKVSKKKVSKKRVKKKRSEVKDEGAAVQPDVHYDDDEEEINEEDENITSEDEEEEEDERKHQKLLAAISSLGGNKRKRNVGERSEAAVNMSEFTVNVDGEGDKIDLSDLIGTMEKTPAVPAKTRKQLKNLQRVKRTIESPLSRQETERIHRDVAFQKASKEVSQWKGIIKQNQRAEQLVFPLNQEPAGPKPMERVVTGWKARTPLEEEIFSLLTANKQPINDPVLTPAEEASLKAMSLEEAKIRRAELQKARALQSYYEARARRESKIKSKKYHKVHNKAKRKEFLKQFDEMVKTDPAAALEELNKMEVARMQERMSLKHQNSGKWAKSKAIMAKYDEGARKAMQQQLEVNKELTQKMVTALNPQEEEEEEEEGAGEEEVLPDFVNDAEPGVDASNPWMRGKLSEDPAEKEATETVDLTGEEEEVVAGNKGEEEEEEEEVEETEEEALLREFHRKRKQRQAQETEFIPVITVDDDEEVEEEKGAAEAPDDEEEEEVEEEKGAAEAPDDEEEEVEEDEPAAEASDKEDEELSEFTRVFRGLTDSERNEAAEDAVSHTDTSAPLEEGLTRVRTLEDVELLGQEEEESAPDEAPAEPPAATAENPPTAAQKAGKKRKRKIELKEVLTKETKHVKVPLAPTVEDAEDSDEDVDQRGLIKEAFAGDDVVADFLKDKRKQEDAGKPKAVDLTLPGWGEWGGTGLKPSRKKCKRFRIKAALPPPRKDERLPSVIISEKRNGAIAAHQVNSLPFPFENHAQFESTVRSPLGRTWNTERTVKKISKPKVVTQLGAIIAPMAREELMKDKRQQQAAAASRNAPNSTKRKL